MANFKIAIPIIAALEGGRNSNPKDNAARDLPPGSLVHTNKGITWNTFKGSAKACGYTATTELFLEMPDNIRDAIAKIMYWDVMKLDKVTSNRKAYLLFDFGFNSGPETAIYQAQKVLGITQDGIPGPQFLTAINATNEDAFTTKYTAIRTAFVRNSGKISESLKNGLVTRIEGLAKKKFTTE